VEELVIVFAHLPVIFVRGLSLPRRSAKGYTSGMRVSFNS
jgi:hypothetical protein